MIGLYDSCTNGKLERSMINLALELFYHLLFFSMNRSLRSNEKLKEENYDEIGREKNYHILQTYLILINLWKQIQINKKIVVIYGMCFNFHHLKSIKMNFLLFLWSKLSIAYLDNLFKWCQSIATKSSWFTLISLPQNASVDSIKARSPFSSTQVKLSTNERQLWATSIQWFYVLFFSDRQATEVRVSFLTPARIFSS